MSDTPKLLIERLGVFEDTDELCTWLRKRAKQNAYTTADTYYLNEVEASLSGLYDLAKRMAEALAEEPNQ